MYVGMWVGVCMCGVYVWGCGMWGRWGMGESVCWGWGIVWVWVLCVGVVGHVCVGACIWGVWRGWVCVCVSVCVCSSGAVEGVWSLCIIFPECGCWLPERPERAKRPPSLGRACRTSPWPPPLLPPPPPRPPPSPLNRPPQLGPACTAAFLWGLIGTPLPGLPAPSCGCPVGLLGHLVTTTLVL